MGSVVVVTAAAVVVVVVVVARGENHLPTPSLPSPRPFGLSDEDEAWDGIGLDWGPR
ncbi:hypothetical protein BO70DRAFT_362061 [Aspergillus heteromorphus CBS 117.55]|uniref:Secreted protein n=1 Tax=Aspergillus heteromorphus CBS 117.55 TaxID=1448321 RepID=A0A317W6A8_9EURO|nr:uncharacterized protein BO70DRAFT_362061 [Aspergillus heteromorphus CBS 117.55]PWY82146.1 hypothetical protein BO70DRAFT_362061 [Aspergillus heteromorphus CBS 117.55]